MPYKIEFYEPSSGRVPLEKYIKGISKRDQAQIVHVIELLEKEGFNLLSTKFMDKITNELYELRIKGEQLHRILLFFWTGSGFILVHAFTKQTNKTPSKEIQLAEERMNLWIEHYQKRTREKGV